MTNISLYQSTRASFRAIVKLCGIQREEIFFTASCSCNIECMLVEDMPSLGLYLTICHMLIWHYQFTQGINVRWHNGRFRRAFTNSPLVELRPRLNSLNQFFTVLYDDALSPNKVHQCSLVVIIHFESCEKG